MKFPKGAIEISGTLILFVIIVGATMASIYGYFKTHDSFDCKGKTDVLIKDLENKFTSFNSGTTTGRSTIEDWKAPRCIVCAYVQDDKLRFRLEGEKDEKTISVTGYTIIPNGNSCENTIIIGGKTYDITVSKVDEDSINANDPLKVQFTVV